MLDVLDADAVGPEEEHRERVRRVDEVVDLDANAYRLVPVLLGRVDEHCDVVQQRALRRLRVTLVELDVRAGDLHPRRPARAGVGGVEPEPLPLARRPLGIGREERDVVEVEVEVGRMLDDADREARLDLLERLRAGRRPQRHVLQRALLPLVRRLEQRQLPAPRVDADERELLVAVDHVHPVRPLAMCGECVPVLHPDCDVVERLRVHAGTVPISGGATSAAGSARCARSRRRRRAGPPRGDPPRRRS